MLNVSGSPEYALSAVDTITDLIHVQRQAKRDSLMCSLADVCGARQPVNSGSLKQFTKADLLLAE